jgi:hypothetical protein
MSTRAANESPPGGFSRQDLLRAHALPENGNSDIYWVDAAFIQALRPGPP